MIRTAVMTCLEHDKNKYFDGLQSVQCRELLSFIWWLSFNSIDGEQSGDQLLLQNVKIYFKKINFLLHANYVLCNHTLHHNFWHFICWIKQLQQLEHCIMMWRCTLSGISFSLLCIAMCDVTHVARIMSFMNGGTMGKCQSDRTASTFSSK